MRCVHSGGTAVSVTDEELIAATREIGAAEGIFCAPEGAACLPALRKLMETGEVKRGERVVLFNTGSGVKYMESFRQGSRITRIDLRNLWMEELANEVCWCFVLLLAATLVRLRSSLHPHG